MNGKFVCKIRILVWFLIIINMLFLCVTVTTIASAQERTSENTQRLQKVLERFPQSDTDGDGILTEPEAIAFRKKMQGTTDEPEISVKKEKSTEQQKKPVTEYPSPTFEEVSYGPHENNVLDFWKVESDTPTPVIVFIHGGGFKGGDKKKIRRQPDTILICLESGVSFASINYRFREHAPLLDILHDTARAIQFLRFKAKEWNIDTSRIASYGGSAGAGSSLWIGVHDDLADSNSNDPVLRESSRISVVGVNAGQATYDFSQWPEVLGISREELEKYIGDEDPQRSTSETLELYGLESENEIEGPKGVAIRKELDMLGHLDAGDPPIYLKSNRDNTPPRDRGHRNHHPRHAIAVKRKCDELGIEAVMVLKDTPLEERVDMLDFFFKHLKVKRKEPNLTHSSSSVHQ